MPSVSTWQGDKEVVQFKFEPASEAGEVIHVRSWGTVSPKLHGNQVHMHVTHQYTRFTHVVGLKVKNETIEACEAYKNLSPRQEVRFNKGSFSAFIALEEGVR